jgi:hypothetical protein
VFVIMYCWRGFKLARALYQLANAPRNEGFHCPSCKAAPPMVLTVQEAVRHLPNPSDLSLLCEAVPPDHVHRVRTEPPDQCVDECSTLCSCDGRSADREVR